MKIAICDDEKLQREEMYNLCEDVAEKYGLKFEYAFFSSGEELVKYKGEKIALLLLDIDLGGMDGVEVLRRIELDDRFWRVVFVSSHTEAVFQTFGIKTLDFGVKPVKEADIEKWINILEREYQEDKLVKFAKYNQDLWVNESEIMYLKAAGNYVEVVTTEGIKNASHNIKYWESKLDAKKLVRVHKSFIVNFEYVENIAEEIELTNGEKLALGRIYKSHVREAFGVYQRNVMRGRLK